MAFCKCIVHNWYRYKIRVETRSSVLKAKVLLYLDTSIYQPSLPTGLGKWRLIYMAECAWTIKGVIYVECSILPCQAPGLKDQTFSGTRPRQWLPLARCQMDRPAQRHRHRAEIGNVISTFLPHFFFFFRSKYSRRHPQKPHTLCWSYQCGVPCPMELNSGFVNQN